MELIFLVLIIAAMGFFMFRSNKKRQSEAAKLRDETVVGADVMTNFGLFGTVLSIDEDENVVEIESTPGTILRVHRQTIARVITPEPEENADEQVAEDADPIASGDLQGTEPEFGERTSPASDADKTDK